MKKIQIISFLIRGLLRSPNEFRVVRELPQAAPARFKLGSSLEFDVAGPGYFVSILVKGLRTYAVNQEHAVHLDLALSSVFITSQVEIAHFARQVLCGVLGFPTLLADEAVIEALGSIDSAEEWILENEEIVRFGSEVGLYKPTHLFGAVHFWELSKLGQFPEIGDLELLHRWGREGIIACYLLERHGTELINRLAERIL